ncbi:MAG: SDR family oxidoreductase [Deltaproteobacteria bacterium]|nr:SDR family oxidoreductase [Deltaproteobacteria bacterium]
MSGISYGLQDKVALVTGGTRGIGLALVRALLGEGARVATCARKEAELAALTQAMEAGDRLLTVPAHVAKEADVAALFAAVEERWGRLDLLVNNVGMNIMTPAVAEADLGLWRKILETNLDGAFLCCRGAAGLMKRSGGGAMVSLSSVAAHAAAAAMGIYGVAKAGVEMLTRVLAAELAPAGIRVNAVAPAMVKTDFSRPFWSDQALHDRIAGTIPLGRLAEPEDVMHPVLFLLSEGASFVTGQTLLVDGGSRVCQML